MKCEHGIPYECMCPDQQKCYLMIGDFDAMTSATPANVPHTTTNHVLGTKHYRPPEVTVHCLQIWSSFICVSFILDAIKGRSHYICGHLFSWVYGDQAV